MMNGTTAAAALEGGYNARIEASRLYDVGRVDSHGRSARLYDAARGLGAGSVRREEAVGALKRAWGRDDPAWPRAAKIAAWAHGRGVKEGIAADVGAYVARWATEVGSNAALELDSKIRRIADAAIFTSPAKLDQGGAFDVICGAIAAVGLDLSEDQLADLEEYVECEVRSRDLRKRPRRPGQKVQVLDPVAIAAEAFSNIVFLSDRRPAWG